MGLFDKVKGWLSFSDDEKVLMDRRAFLKGMAVTSAGVLLPGAAVFDMARAALPVDTLVAQIQAHAAEGIAVYMNGIIMEEGPDYFVDYEGSSFQVHPNSGLLLPSDIVTIDYTAKLDDDKKIRISSEVLTGEYDQEKRFSTQFLSMG